MEKETGCASNATRRFGMQAALRIDMDDPSVLVMTRQERQTVMPGEGDPFMDYGIVKDIMEEEEAAERVARATNNQITNNK